MHKNSDHLSFQLLSCSVRVQLHYLFTPPPKKTLLSQGKYPWVLFHSYFDAWTSLHTFPGRGPSCAFVAAGWGSAVAGGLAQGTAEVFVHHWTDVSLEVGEEDASWADVLGLGRLLLLGHAVLLLYSGRGMAGERVPSAYGFFLHFGIESQFLKQHKRYHLILFSFIFLL